MKKQPDYDYFKKLLGTHFHVELDSPDELTLELVKVEELPAINSNRDESWQKPFTAEFRGPMEPILNQGIFRLKSPDQEVLELFIVPVGPEDGGMVYEAVFN